MADQSFCGIHQPQGFSPGSSGLFEKTGANALRLIKTWGCSASLLLTSAILTGCAEDQTADVPSLPVMVSELTPAQPEAAVREVNRDELQQLISSSERPVLVEFSVLSGCYRCDDMRSPIRRKATELQQQADVVRIDFNLNQKLAREVGATVCPSYVVYSQGQVASVRTWPTSPDFVADDVQLAVAALKSDSAASAEGRPQ